MNRAPCPPPTPRDAWELRLLQRHSLPPWFARTHADLRNGRPD